MISDWRKSFKKKEYQATIWFVVFAFAVFSFVPDLVKKLFVGGDWVVSVNSNYVTVQDFVHKVDEKIAQINYFRQMFGKQADGLLESAGFSLNPKEEAIKTIVNETLIRELGKKINLQLNHEFIRQEIIKIIKNNFPQAISETGEIDVKMLSHALNYKTVAAFEKTMEDNLINSFILGLIAGGTYIPEFELKEHYNDLFAKKKYSVLVFPFEKYLSEIKSVPLTNEEIEKFFKEQNERSRQYWTSEKKEGVAWEFGLESYGIKPSTDAEILSYYNKNKQMFLKRPAQVQVRRILFKNESSIEKVKKIRDELVKDPNKFADFAKKFSADKETSNKGGLTDFFSRGQKEQSFEQAAFILKPNEISEPIKTSEGLELLQLVEKRPATYKELSDIKDQVKNILEKDKLEQQFKIDTKNFVNKLKFDQQSFDTFVKTKGAKEKHLGLTDKPDSSILKKLLEMKEEGSLIAYYDDGKGIIVKLTKIQKTTPYPLQEIRNKVVDDLYKQKAVNKLKSELKRAKEEAKTKSFDEIKNAFNVKLINTPWIDNNTKDVEVLKKDKIPLEELLKLDKEDMISEYFNKESHGYLIKLDSIEPFNIEDFNKKKAALKQELFRERQQDLDFGFIASLQKNAKININSKILNKIGY